MKEAVRFGSIDLFKGLCILAILILHSPINLPVLTLKLFQIAVPAFILIATVNNFNSLERNPSIKEFYSRRCKRLVSPFLIAYFASIAIGVVFGLSMNFGARQLIGYFPLEGPGNYFLPLLFQLVAIFPLIYFCYKKLGSIPTFFALLTVYLVYDMVFVFYNRLPTASHHLPVYAMLVFFGLVVARWSVWRKDWSLPVVNWFGRNSYPIFLAQIIFFRVMA